MKRYLITGFSGFVSKYFVDFLENNHEKVEVFGIDIIKPTFDINSYKNILCYFQIIDLLNKDQIDNLFNNLKPDYIVHFASYSSVSYSWKKPVDSFINNTNIFLNIIEAVREKNISCRILSIGSSEEYGKVNKSEIPLDEESSLNPISPYAVARVSQEMISKLFANSYELDILMTRSFNHIGPGQKDAFVVSSLAKQLIELKCKGFNQGEVLVGDISIIRDFVDVRDVVNAYYLLLKKGKKGEIYNVCSGKGISISDLIDKMSKKLNIHVVPNVKRDYIRPNDNKIIVGSNDKIKDTVGWSPVISLDRSLDDILSYWMK